MELEFDKEIDAILRKARDGTIAAAATAPASSHVDADTIAAFVENAIPEKTRLLYVAHLADCDRCRSMLSQAVKMHSEADATPASVASATPAAVPGVSWISRIFRSPSFALAMGVLVLAFTGILGYLAVQERMISTSSSASNTARAAANAPSSSSYPAASSNAVSNTAAVSNMAPANTSVASAANSAASSNSASSAAKPAVPGDGAIPGTDKDLVAGGAVPEAAKPMAAPPPAPVADQPKTDTVAKSVDDKAKEERKVTALARRDEAADQRGREMELKQAKRNDGPSRASGQVQQQENNVYNSNAATESQSRRVGGRTFSYRNGVWYDAAYHGQATINVQRGTEPYNKLGKDVRSIADSLGGTVVVVSNSKAYRIQ